MANLIDLENDPYAQSSGQGQHRNDGLNPFDSVDHLSNPYEHNGQSIRNVAHQTTSHDTFDQYDYFDGTGIAADIDDNDFIEPVQSQSKPSRNMFGRIRRRLGLGQQYSEMDIPLTDAAGTGGFGSQTRDAKKPKLVNDEPRDFDIRHIYYRLLGKDVGPKDQGPRTIYINDPAANNSAKRFSGNHISTTKYNVATFVPKFLFEQFSKYANLFFLFTSCIQQVPRVSPTNRFTTIGTLAVVLLVSAIKELIEDFKRNSADQELNNSKIQVLENGDFVEKKWIKVRVGDIVRVTSEEPFPADLVLLASSEPEGLCYIETANLDGETNLKIKQAAPETAGLVDPHALGNVQGNVVSEGPNSSLYTFEATMNIGQKQIALAPDQLLLRGATLRNTPWIHGLVVFTGHETKLMRNATATPIKRTNVEHVLNIQIIFLFSILILLSITSSLGNVLSLVITPNKFAYLQQEGTNKVGLFFLDMLTYWVLYSNLVPISLFVTVEVIKFYQAYLISSDLDMYYKERDVPAICRTSSLVEELGQIDHIFSDKTGTLTRNIMEFKACSIAGRAYATEVPEDRKVTVVDGVEIGFNDLNTLTNDISGPNGQIIAEFFTLLAACHTVIPEIKPNGKIKYQAASPDEGALVDGAASLGYIFTVRKPKSIAIEIAGESYEYELLNICEFNSTRKRMSAIFRCPDGQIRLYCKGADTVILERLGGENQYIEQTMRHLEDFASEGLRTLCLAMRVIPDAEYEHWNKSFQAASVSLDGRAEKLEAVAEEIEHSLYLLGATAIEDKLQEGVPETIHTLQNAGIKVWVLTGDRQETAINIGMSCKLLSEDMNLLIVNEESAEATLQNIENKLTAIRLNSVNSSEKDLLALVVDGRSLGFALEGACESKFLELAMICKSVICCRVSPLQKALVVKMVKRNTKGILLAIGDGANDVSMIQAAHVGVGISGMEGTQAARSADVSIGQFKYLRKLLLVHGSWSYQRLSTAILYSFYKNIALYMTQFWFVFFNGFSGQSLFESWTMTFYNVFFTVAPPFVMGVFDQFISARLLDRYPQLYNLGRSGTFFNIRKFWEWVINGFYHSIILFFGAYAIYKYGFDQADGLITNNWAWGVGIYTACVVTVLGKAALVTSMWNKFTVVAIIGSLGVWIAFFPIYAVVAPLIHVSYKEYRGVLGHVYPQLWFWAMVGLLPVMCLIRDLAWKYYARMYRPKSYHYVQEIQKYNIADYRPRMEQFQKAIRKVRQVQRMRKQRGFAFSQDEAGGQERVVRAYDTTQQRGRYGELK